MSNYFDIKAALKAGAYESVEKWNKFVKECSETNIFPNMNALNKAFSLFGAKNIETIPLPT